MSLSLPSRRSLASRIGRALLGPLGFGLHSGYFRSCLKGYAVDRSGAPIPMYTYPVVDLLIASKKYFAEKTILEFGSGQSTRWWAQHAKRVIAVEFDEEFANAMGHQLRKMSNIEIIIGDEYKRLVTGEFDVVSIDGHPRIEAARFIVGKVAAGGFVIVDNSDIQSLNEVCTILANAGYYRIDFIGYSPSAYFKQCTSIFFADPAFFGWSRHVEPVSPRSYTERLV
jgi:precorrin-6B methylase 2